MDDLPNILWIFSDQHRAQALGCYGDENLNTPHFDRLAEEGIRFNRAYANTPLCSPFRASLYTGRYATTHGVTTLHRPPNPDITMLPEILQGHGYHTCHLGKWHLSGGAAPCHFVSPYFRPGWDDWAGWENSNRPWETKYACGSMPRPIKVLPGYQADGLTELSLDWMQEYKSNGENKPWFQVLSYETPHPPNTAPDEFLDRFKNKDLELRPNVPLDSDNFTQYQDKLKSYYGQIENLDYNLGRILNKLEELDELDNTLIFYFSDHGDLMGSHDLLGKCRPEEESSRIPLIMRWPDRIPAGQVTEMLISGVDLMPTLLGLIDIPVPDGVEGVNLSNTIKNTYEDKGHPFKDNILLQFEHSFFEPRPEQTFRSIITDRWSYTYFLAQETNQLYDLQEDPYQMNNLIDDQDYQKIRDELHQLLYKRLDDIGDDFFKSRGLN